MLLRHRASLGLTAVGAFAPTSGKPVTATARFTLRR
jgi:hypothetical protein